MHKQVNPVSVLKPSAELTTSARVKLYKLRKHVQKLNNEDLDTSVARAIIAIEKLEESVKLALRQAVSK